jgi:hypothetical protein
MPNLVSTLVEWDPHVFSCVLRASEQAKLNGRGVFGKNRKVHAVTHPGCAERIWLSEKRSYGSHERAAHLSGIEHILAMRNGGSDKS